MTTDPRDEMPATEVVCLCAKLDLQRYFGGYVDDVAPWIRLRLPHEIEAPERIEYALGWKPAAGAFSSFPNLRLVTSIGAGVDAILACPDLPDRVIVSSLKDPEQAAMMAGFAAWHVIRQHREMAAYARAQRERRWDPFNKSQPSSFPVGVLGFGHMGRAVAGTLAMLGYPVEALARRATRAPMTGVTVVHGDGALYELAARVRVLVNVLPLTAATEAILDARLFRAMRGGHLVQIGRGEHLVEADLLTALDHGQLESAALDVFAHEPLDPAHPFWTHPRIVVTPHVASEAHDRNVVAWLAAEIGRVRRGEPAHGAVDRRSGY